MVVLNDCLELFKALTVFGQFYGLLRGCLANFMADLRGRLVGFKGLFKELFGGCFK